MLAVQRNPGTGNVRLYTLRELLQIVAMARISSAHGILPSAITLLSQHLAETMIDHLLENRAAEVVRLLDGGTSEEVRAFMETVAIPGFMAWRGLGPPLKKWQDAAKNFPPEEINDRVAEMLDEQCLIFSSKEDLGMNISGVTSEMDSWSFLVIDLAWFGKAVLAPAVGLWWQALKGESK
jgi:hypothetical protein